MLHSYRSFRLLAMGYGYSTACHWMWIFNRESSILSVNYLLLAPYSLSQNSQLSTFTIKSESLCMSSQPIKKPRLETMAGTSKMSAVFDAIKQTRVFSGPINVNSKYLLGTHDGTFHCDEAMALSFLKILPELRDSEILRTRKPDLLAQCHMVVDVGAVFDPATHRYDHHQREFTGVLEGYNTKLSSAGLVYQHFGRQILREVLKTDVPASEEFVEICFHKLYKGFVEHVDAIDNGISVSDEKPRYHVSTTLSSRVGFLNPAWNQEQTSEVMNEKFKEAMVLTCSEFISHALSLADSWWPARSIVQSALDNRHNVHASGKILVLDQACPWKEHLFEIEETLSGEKVLYALYADLGGSWRIQAVPEDPTSFNSRKKLPADWCGLRDEVLSEKVGISGAIFIHASGFIGGHNTKEGALAMAIQALDL